VLVREPKPTTYMINEVVEKLQDALDTKFEYAG
jgi:hypothetical protein